MTTSWRRPLRFLSGFAVLLALVVAACASQSRDPVPVTGGTPRLVVVLIVDGLPARQMLAYRDQLSPDGFERFMQRGAWFTEAYQVHAHTATGPGHAAVLTGASPQRHGIIGNEWLDRETGEMHTCAQDVSARYIGVKTGKDDGTSPRNLKTESVGDVLRRVDARSKVIAVSAKDRGAILPAGKAGTAYLYHEETGLFVTSTYYMKEYPQWVKDFNAKRPADDYFHKEWKPLLPDAAYARSMADEQKWYARGGKLPKTMGEGMDKPGPKYYEGLIGSPFNDDLLLNFARAAIAGEQLGRDGSPDILVVSLSAHDYVNHSYSAESRISHDHMLHLDLLLQAFMLDLDAAVGRENYIAVLTADHGFTPAPEYSRSLGRDAGRFNLRAAIVKMNAELAKKHGEGRWIRGSLANNLLLNRKLAAEKGVDFTQLSEEVRRMLLAEPAVAAVYSSAEFEANTRKDAPHFEAMRRSWNRDVSGDLQVALKPYWIISSGSGSAATHGQPTADDQHVPLAVYGPPWVMAARLDTRVAVTDIAPTLARLLHVPPPSSSEGRPLPIGVPGS